MTLDFHPSISTESGGFPRKIEEAFDIMIAASPRGSAASVEPRERQESLSWTDAVPAIFTGILNTRGKFLCDRSSQNLKIDDSL